MPYPQEREWQGAVVQWTTLRSRSTDRAGRREASPIWYRPQYYGGELYKSDTLLQVVGHTPVEKITREGNLISCDVFSTDRDRKPIGTQEYLIIDTLTWAHQGIR